MFSISLVHFAAECLGSKHRKIEQEMNNKIIGVYKHEIAENQVVEKFYFKHCTGALAGSSKIAGNI